MEVFIYHPTDGWTLSIHSQLLSCIMYIIMTFLNTIMIRTSIVPLFKSCEDKKIWLWLSTPSFWGTIGFWLLFMDAENFVQIPDTMYIGSLLLFITLLVSNIVGVKNIKISIKSAIREDLISGEILTCIKCTADYCTIFYGVNVKNLFETQAAAMGFTVTAERCISIAPGSSLNGEWTCPDFYKVHLRGLDYSCINLLNNIGSMNYYVCFTLASEDNTWGQ